MRGHRLVLAFGGLLALVLTGCGGPGSESEPVIEGQVAEEVEASLVVATSRLGPITIQNIEELVGRLGAAYAPDPQQTLAERYHDLARRLVLESLLLEDTPEGDEALDNLQALDLKHQVYVYSQYFLTTLDPPAEITEVDLRAAFEERRDQFRREETRRVSHIFLRYPADGEQLPTWRRIEAIRQQIVEGRPFQQMAREVSDSETRHRDGLIGFVTRGTFPPDFDRIVFALEPEVPSEPVPTADGAHLFYVSNILEASDPSFDELRELLAQSLRVERQAEHLRAAAEALPLPTGSHVTEPQTLRRLLEGADDDREVLQVGDFRLTLGALREQLESGRRALGELADDGLAERLLAEWHDRARIYHALREREAAGERIDLPRESLAAQHRLQRVEARLQAAVRAYVENDAESLAQHHTEHALRFVSPLRLEIDRLTVPIAEDSGTAMARLEAARGALDAGDQRLAALAQSMGGEVTRLGPLTLSELSRIDPSAFRFAALLRVGEHSPPYRAGDTLALFAVLARGEPQPLPLDAVRQQVIDDILKHQGPAIARQISEAMLEEASFRIDEEALARLTTRP